MHRASVLADEKVFIVSGGWNASRYLNSAELYDPPTRTWITTNNMTNTRSAHTASMLTDRKVLVSGG
jgi:hypothetical protein